MFGSRMRKKSSPSSRIYFGARRDEKNRRFVLWSEAE